MRTALLLPTFDAGTLLLSCPSVESAPKDRGMLTATCPCCGAEAVAHELRSSWGVVFVGELTRESRILHRDCDLMRVDRALRVEAVRRSAVQVFSVFNS
jgi:hypothetical protein